MNKLSHAQLIARGIVRCETEHKDLITMRDEELHTSLYMEACRMRDLLHAVNEATGPGASEQQLPDALAAVSTYIDSLPR